MEELTPRDLELRKEEIIDRIKNGAVFIYPTDTIYGVGCDASNTEAIQKIRQLKDRQNSPFSIWVPSRRWIEENCQSSKEIDKWLLELPGAYTLILKLKNKKCVASNINPGNQTIGVRMPDHWFRKFVRELNLPIVTTSANKTGKSFMTSLEDLDPEIKNEIDFIIYEGEKKAKPSKLIDLTAEEKVIER
ncbi:threonylcarbamoyl-AMP synthase [Candidatus Woesearchaeota archaeon]|nr:threonylcarbamoyl-AMP synthase [Candidatus Woesearchaeota archaeon]